MKIGIRAHIKSAIVAMLFFAAIVALRADTITVTNTNDSGPGSLRQALADANDGDTITFAVTGTIGLTSGELLVDKDVTISGPGAAGLALNGNGKSRVFHIGSGTTVTISGLTITNGHGSFPDNGGGIFTELSTLTVTDCGVSDNSADLGGGIYNLGSSGNATVQVVNSTLSGNSAGLGGAIVNAGSDGNASLQVVNSTLSGNGNSDTFSGGGIYNDGTTGEASLQVVNSTLSSNLAENGSGIFNSGASGSASLQVINSTLSGNHNGNPTTFGVGGGIYNDGTFGSANLQVVNSTLSGNLADEGGGIFNAGDSGKAVVEIGSTVLNAGASGENIVNQKDDGATVTSLGYNLSSDDGGGFLTATGDQINTDPMLGPFQDNGGPTFTHELLSGSPAIDAGDPDFTPPPVYDQRGPGFDRVVNGRIDIGSFEVQGPTPTPSPAPTATPTPRLTPTPRPRPTPHARP